MKTISLTFFLWPSSQWGQTWNCKVALASPSFLFLCTESRMQLITEWGSQSRCQQCLLKCYTCGLQTARLPKPSCTHEEVVSQPPPESALPVKEMESLWSAWWSFILSSRQINSLMIDSDWTCMKKPFIYSWNLICPVLWSDAFDKM